jgi:4-hydroxybutyrate dehydrogenase/sulfolactaldehyde 3-reductase
LVFVRAARKNQEERSVSNRKLGFIGLGAMGSGMVKSLRRAGFAVTVYDMRAEARAAAVKLGAVEARSAREAATGADIVLSSLPVPADVEAVVLGPDGILPAMRSGSVYIDLSSIDPQTTRKVGAALAERGVRMIDSPVGPGPDAAERGELTLMLGGERSVIEECQDVLRAIGSRQFYCGPLGCGVTTKVVNNLVSCSINALNGEALVLGQKAGLDLDVLIEVMSTTAADNRHLHVTGHDRILAGNFEPNFRLALAHKDLGLAIRYALQLGVPLPIANAAHLVHSLGMGAGLGEEGQAACVKVIEQVAGVQARRAKAKGK